MRIHYLQHVPFEGLAYMASWMEEKQIPYSGTPLYQPHTLPDRSAFDGLIIMGGPMGVHDETKFPWLNAEMRFIEQAISDGKTVIGICLGAQLIAHVLGARVYRNSVKEIGWFPVQKRAAAVSVIDSIWPDTFQAFHWHGETFDIPRDGIHFMKSDACENQGFIYQGNVIGLQFHLESTRKSIEDLMGNCGEDLDEKGPYIQDRYGIRGREKHLLQCNDHMARLLEAFIQ